MKFLDRFETVKLARDELNSLGLPSKHRCMRCGVNHRILWEHVRFQYDVVSVGVTRCGCGDEVTSFFAKESVLSAASVAEVYRRKNPVKIRR